MMDEAFNDHGFRHFILGCRRTWHNLVGLADNRRTDRHATLRINLIWEQVRDVKEAGGHANEWKPGVARLYNHLRRHTPGPLFEVRDSKFDVLVETDGYFDALLEELR